MANTKFQRLSYASVFQQLDKTTITLVAGAVAAAVATLDVTPLGSLTVSIDVTVAPLTGLEVWARGDKYGRWFPVPIDQLDGYGRSDAGIDVAATPKDVGCFLMMSCAGWSDIEIRAKSGGAAKLSISVGGK